MSKDRIDILLSRLEHDARIEFVGSRREYAKQIISDWLHQYDVPKPAETVLVRNDHDGFVPPAPDHDHSQPVMDLAATHVPDQNDNTHAIPKEEINANRQERQVPHEPAARESSRRRSRATVASAS